MILKKILGAEPAPPGSASGTSASGTIGAHPAVPLGRGTGRGLVSKCLVKPNQPVKVKIDQKNGRNLQAGAAVNYHIWNIGQRHTISKVKESHFSQLSSSNINNFSQA